MSSAQRPGTEVGEENMRRGSTSGPRRLFIASFTAAVAVAAAVAVVLSLSGAGSPVKLGARNYECHGTALPSRPTAQGSDEHGDGGDRPCTPRSEAESFQDL